MFCAINEKSPTFPFRSTHLEIYLLVGEFRKEAQRICPRGEDSVLGPLNRPWTQKDGGRLNMARQTQVRENVV